MEGYITNIAQAALHNTDFRRVLYTAPNSQLVLMSLQPGEEIGSETHQLDQYIRCEAGLGQAMLNGREHMLLEGSGVLVPAGVEHNIVNTGTEPMKLYTIYAPPNHRDGVVHETRADALADEEEFDGVTTK